MPRPVGELSAATQAMYKILNDNGRHLQSVVVDKVASKVNPAEARAILERRRRASQAKRNPANPDQPRQRPLSVATQIETGARILAIRAVNNAVRNGSIRREYDDENNEVWLQQTPRRLPGQRGLSEIIGRNESTISGWVSDPRHLTEIRKLLPEGVPPYCRDDLGRVRFRPEMIDAWRTYSSMQRTLPDREIAWAATCDVLARVLRSTPELGLAQTRPEALATLAARIMRDLRTQSRAAGYHLNPHRVKPPSPADGAPEHQTITTNEGDSTE